LKFSLRHAILARHETSIVLEPPVNSAKDSNTRLAVIGGGSWGTTLASLVSRNAQVTLWARDAGVVREINDTHTHARYLEGLSLNPLLRATTDLEAALSNAHAVFVAIPSHMFRSVFERVAPSVPVGVPIISMTKGLEASTQKRMTEIIREFCPQHPIGVLSGPNLAKEILTGKAAASVLALDDPAAQWLQPTLNVGLFRVYHNDDVTGCELGGVLKNIIALAVGLGDGLGAGDNTRAALITRGLAEATRLGHGAGWEARDLCRSRRNGRYDRDMHQCSESKPLCWSRVSHRKNC
jgi:glycerol-3-phosphate dehydrogenase (NAD(P)+)